MKVLFLLPAVVLVVTACGPKRQVVNLNPEGFPAYCVRGVEPVGDGVHVMVDMPGFYGQSRNDAPMKTTIETHESLNVPECTADDPRMTETNE